MPARRGILATAILSFFLAAFFCGLGLMTLSVRNGAEAQLAMERSGLSSAVTMTFMPAFLLGDLLWRPLPILLFLLLALAFGAAGVGLLRRSSIARRLEVALLWGATTVLIGSGLSAFLFRRWDGFLTLAFSTLFARAVWYLSKKEIRIAFGEPDIEGPRWSFALSLAGSLGAAIVLFGALAVFLFRGLAGLR